MASSLARPALLFFGKIVTSDIPKAVKVSIDKYAMDKRLTMYFKEKTEVYAYDSKKCSEGDYVIVKEIPADTFEDKKINFNVERLVYKAGYFVDPVSGRRNAGTEYIDNIKKTTELFGCTRPYEKSDTK